MRVKSALAGNPAPLSHLFIMQTRSCKLLNKVSYLFKIDVHKLYFKHQQEVCFDDTIGQFIFISGDFLLTNTCKNSVFACICPNTPKYDSQIQIQIQICGSMKFQIQIQIHTFLCCPNPVSCTQYVGLIVRLIVL